MTLREYAHAAAEQVVPKTCDPSNGCWEQCKALRDEDVTVAEEVILTVIHQALAEHSILATLQRHDYSQLH